MMSGGDRIVFIFVVYDVGFVLAGESFCACWRGILACWRGISRAIELLFFMDSKGNVRRVFLACVLHALGSNPAGVRVFRNRASKGHLPMVLLG